MKIFLVGLFVAFGCTSAVIQEAESNNRRTDELIESIDDSKTTPDGRILSDTDYRWLRAELEQCKADRITTAKTIHSLNQQNLACEQEFQSCQENLVDQSEAAGLGRFVYWILGLAVFGNIVQAFTKFNLKNLITGGGG